MEFIKKRQNDPEYLKTVIAQRQIVIEEQIRKFQELTKQNNKLKSQYQDIQKQKQAKEEAASRQIINLNAAIKHLQAQIQMLNHEKHQNQFVLNNSKTKLQEVERQHKSELQSLRDDFEGQRDLLNSKIVSLEKNLADLRKYYKVEENIVEDKRKIIEDSNRDLRGFSNQKQQRMLIIQNQQFKNEIQYQSKNITIQLQRNQKLLQQIKTLKLDLQLHKEIQSDLVKRSSLAQTLIKKLYKQMQELRKTHSQGVRSSIQTPSYDLETQQAVTSRQSVKSQQKEQNQTINKLKFQIANIRNENHYMHNMQKIYSKKYQTLGSLLADYLENLLYSKETNSQQIQGAANELTLNIHELRSKDVKEWRIQQMQAVIHLLLTQIKPFLSKTSLVTFPEVKNVNISFVEESPKQMISLPKIAQNYEKSYEKQAKKGQNRFKDIPIDISTKILRSNLRQWGSKIRFGNMPINKAKSRSIVEQNQKSFL